jgi:histidinol-phosphatase
VTPDLELALALAGAADAISLARFRTDLAMETKPDLTPVTEADREVETALRRLLAESRPDDAVHGEELGATGDSSRRWIVDPIDGTKNFARGVPVWATLIALQAGEKVELGVVSAPALGRRWWAERGGGAFAADGGGEPLHVSGVERIEEAVLNFALDRPPPDLAWRAWHVRGLGDFWAHMLVAEGAVEAAVDSVGVNVWDVAPVQVIVEEAGGRYSDFEGEARLDSGTAVTSNGLVHDELLVALRDRSGS